ncbi:hypothetical protein Bbelb_225740 [Branchiostoma belcheri]|nr:hypothetical protein Bbelb_225740 [Branchiostoma belcheri]
MTVNLLTDVGTWEISSRQRRERSKASWAMAEGRKSSKSLEKAAWYMHCDEYFRVKPTLSRPPHKQIAARYTIEKSNNSVYRLLTTSNGTTMVNKIAARYTIEKSNNSVYRLLTTSNGTTMVNKRMFRGVNCLCQWPMDLCASGASDMFCGNGDISLLKKSPKLRVFTVKQYIVNKTIRRNDGIVRQHCSRLVLTREST